MAKILLVDDEPEVAGLMTDWLRLRGYDVLRAADGLEALRVARSDRPDLILLDAFMPGLDGLETGRRLRAQPETRAMPIVLIAGEDAAGAQVDRLMSGASDAVTRPVALDDLGRRLRALLEGHLPGVERADALARAAVGAAVAGLPCQMAWLFGPEDGGDGWVSHAAIAPGHPEALPPPRAPIVVPAGDTDHWLAQPLLSNVAEFNVALDDIRSSADDLVIQAAVRLQTGYLTLIPLGASLGRRPAVARTGLLLLASRDPLDMAQESIRRGLLAATSQAGLALDALLTEHAPAAPIPPPPAVSAVPERTDSPDDSPLHERSEPRSRGVERDSSPPARGEQGEVRARFQAMREATLAALIAPSLDGALQAIISQAARALNVRQMAALLLVTRGGDTLVVHRAAGLRARRLEDAALLLEGSLTDEALKAGHPVIFQLGQEPRSETALVEDLTGSSVTSAAAAGLVVRGEPAGALLAVNPAEQPGARPNGVSGADKPENTFSQEDLDLLQSLANLTSIAMGGARLTADLAGRAHGLTVLHRAATASSSQPIPALLDSITRLVLDGLAVKACVVRGWESARDELSTLARRIDYRRGVAPRTIQLSGWPSARQAVQAGAAVRVSGSLRETRGGDGMRSLMIVPVGDRMLCVLGHPSANQVFTDEHVAHCRDAAAEWDAEVDAPEVLAHDLLAAVEAPWCVVYRLDPGRESMQRVAELGHVSFGARGPEADPVDDASLRRSLLVSRKTMTFSAADERLSPSDRALGSPFEAGQTLMTPILYYGQPIGLIEALDDNPGRSFAEHDRLILQAVASLIGAAIGRERTGGPPRPMLRPETEPAGAVVVGGLFVPPQVSAADEGPETPPEGQLEPAPLAPIRPAWIALRQEMASLEAVARDAVDDLLPAALAAGVTIQPFYGEFLPDIYVDTARMAQVITILLENAIQHSARGGKVTLAIRQLGDSVQVEVADHGSGIPFEDQAAIFQKGVSDDPAKIRGLALVSQVIKAHDGRIWLVSQPGSGSAFAFSLPAAALSGPDAFAPSF